MKKMIYHGNSEFFNDVDLRKFSEEIGAEKLGDSNVYYSDKHGVGIFIEFFSGYYDTKVSLFGTSKEKIGKVEKKALNFVKSIKRDAEGFKS